MIRIYSQQDIPGTLKQQIDLHIGNTFGHIPFVQQYQWAQPDWTVGLFEGDELVTFYGIVERHVELDSVCYKAAGINNVITPAQFRGKGYSTKALRETQNFLFKELQADMGMLICADQLVEFYGRLGWHKISCKVYFNQADQKHMFDSSSNLMLLTQDDNRYNAREIDMNGLPW